jgi:hypothetical protein
MLFAALGRNAAALLAVLCLLIAPAAMAQRSRTDVKITSLKFDNERTPSFKDSNRGSQGSRDMWCRIDLAFDTKGASGGWIDEIEIFWLVLAESDQYSKPLVMTQSVFYTDVEDGKHSACIYLKPKFFKRYLGSSRVDTRKLSVYAEIRIAGQRVAREERKTNRMPDGWYNKAEAAGRILSSELLPKSRTPFAALDYDYYEHEKANF